MAFPYRKILCPIDFDKNSIEALDKAVEIARHFSASLVVVHVVPMVLEFPNMPHTLDRYEEHQRTAQARLDEITARRLTGIAYESATYVGDVIGSVLQAADKFEPDLLVMATHGREGLAHFFLGSVAEAIVRKARCPVLTVRSEGRAGEAEKR